jgi:hypothetical protein
MCLNKTYGKVSIGKHLSDNFPIQNGLKQGDALSPLLFNFALEDGIKKVQKNQVGLKLNVTQKRLVYAADEDLLGETSIDARKETGLEVNAEEVSICRCLVIRMKGKIII